jgi:hypothetical protein
MDAYVLEPAPFASGRLATYEDLYRHALYVDFAGFITHLVMGVTTSVMGLIRIYY